MKISDAERRERARRRMAQKYKRPGFLAKLAEKARAKYAQNPKRAAAKQREKLLRAQAKRQWWSIPTSSRIVAELESSGYAVVNERQLLFPAFIVCMPGRPCKTERLYEPLPEWTPQ